nr:hypothetical protein [Tanacetum cinerariifolium]
NYNREKAHDTTPSIQQVVSPVSDHSMPAIRIIPEDSSLNPHDEPSSILSANPTITVKQAATLSTSEVLAQTTTAHTQIQNNSLLEQHMFDLRRNSHSDPLHIELERLSSVKEKMVKSYHGNIRKINIDRAKEIAEAIDKIKLKYHSKRQEWDATFNSQMKEVENNMYTVERNQVLAATFRQKYQDVSHDCVAVQGVLF